MKNPVALICGVSGQEGAYLDDFLLENGYDVSGTSRDSVRTNFYLISNDVQPSSRGEPVPT